MLKSATSKGMWLGRATVFMVGLAVIVGLIFGVLSRATAHTGSVGLFHLNHNNPVTALSTLTGNLAGSVLKVDNNGTGTALSLEVGSGKAPLRVNSTAGKATNLNADKVDSFNASELVRGASASDVVNTTTSPHPANLFTVSAPREGGLLVNIAFACNSASGSTDTRWSIITRVDGAGEGLDTFLTFPHAALQSTPGDSTSLTAFVPVNAGDHIIGYNAFRESGDGSLNCNISVSSLFVPFGDSGTVPTTTQALSQQRSESGGAQR
jgi:hypothetical protein